MASTFAVRLLLVILFFPFSALDKALNFAGAVAQAKTLTGTTGPARALVLAGLLVEIVMPACILTGQADRFAAFVMAAYCGVTALLWKQFWRPGDFWAGSDSKGRGLFWDFLKNVSLAGGFLTITFGSATLAEFIGAPFASTHPYSAAP